MQSEINRISVMTIFEYLIYIPPIRSDSRE